MTALSVECVCVCVCVIQESLKKKFHSGGHQNNETLLLNALKICMILKDQLHVSDLCCLWVQEDVASNGSRRR